MHKISIIIPCYNHGNKISRAIESCDLIQANKEIIVINDGSTDNTEEVVKKFSNVKLINQNNKGLGNARNIGVLSATHDNILPIDADDEFLIGANELFKYINDYDVIYGNVINSPGHLDTAIHDKSLSNDLFEYGNFLTSVFLFKKNVWSSIGGFSEDRLIYEDWDFTAKAFYKNFKFKYVNTDVFIYHRYSDGMLSNKTKNHDFHVKATRKSIAAFKTES